MNKKDLNADKLYIGIMKATPGQQAQFLTVIFSELSYNKQRKYLQDLKRLQEYNERNK